MKRFVCSLAASCFYVSLLSQPVPNQSVLTIDQIMQGNKFVGSSPSRIFWSMESDQVYFNWNPEADTLSSLYKISLTNKEPVKVSLEEEMSLPGSGGAYNQDSSLYLYQSNGDLFLMELQSGKRDQLTNTIEREGNPQFTDNGEGIIFTREDNLFLLEEPFKITQLTQFKKGKAPRERSPSDFRRWIAEEQMELIDILEERAAEREARSRRRAARRPQRPLEIYLGNDNVSDLKISPDLRFVTYRLSRNSAYQGTKVPNYVTEDGFIEELRGRSKVGAPQSTFDFGIYDREKDTTYLINTEQIEGIYDKPDFMEAYHEGEEPYNDQFDKPREVIVHGPVYSDDGKAMVVIRSLDNKDRWIMALNLEEGSLRLLDRQRDEAWIGGPGIGSWNYSAGNVGWLKDNEHFYFQSEETGYAHLYTMNFNTGEKKALTSGDFEILSAELSKDKSTFFITANAFSPHEHHFYHLPVEGGEMVRITSMTGNNDVTLSPDEKMLAIRYSYSNKPWELYLMENKAGAEAAQITESTTAAFKAYKWRDPQIVYFEAEDGAQVPARIYRPERAKRNGPAVIFVHGAGYLQNVHKWWSSYYREYMFHNLLVDNGYTVLDIDYRASNGYGRDWRTGIYRHMGGKDLSDHIDGAKFLVEEYNIDPERIGIYGGSYGGFITLMALFNAPGTFKCGAALRSVTDWAHYNHGYTSNILNTPVEDPEAFRKSSPIYFAEGLEDHLLILHGMIDVNVQFQDVVRLAQRLIELEKENWEFAVFPLEDHGFAEPSSWTDEYKRIFKLFQTQLK